MSTCVLDVLYLVYNVTQKDSANNESKKKELTEYQLNPLQVQYQILW